ncbi:ATP-binding cassette sub-family A member 3 [Orchesella cincta]|uniref:ATP-binding cassette sub-family A member 3 n=1 Tax=Orchesella cincta TaxID=48709 RepID=A0A1D2M7J5_ORCCI|nr:ATP-binding cassette sub-family A member 3 [Orchesella cincta]
MSLTVYLENVLPSKFGVRKPWYYIFQLSTYVNSKPNGSVVGPAIEVDGGVEQVPGFEVQESNADVGIDIRNLRKNFGSNKVAVDGVSMKMYNGEIFALLGHNGAGKTTTISMLTGMFAPSSGTAKHNMLFNKLTVREHLRFFGQLKGLSSKAASNEIKILLPKLQLAEKATTISSNLSGGQMRKLCLGIALIGNSKVVILDEPTSGMDPEARREADVLGDRLGIMTNGKLSCQGHQHSSRGFMEQATP